jgi:hypothetical protein
MSSGHDESVAHRGLVSQGRRHGFGMLCPLVYNNWQTMVVAVKATEAAGGGCRGWLRRDRRRAAIPEAQEGADAGLIPRTG